MDWRVNRDKMATFSNSNNGYTVTLTVEETSSSSANNTSTIQYSLVLKSTTKSFSDYTVNYSTTINGTKVIDKSEKKSIKKNSSITLASGSQTIYHNSDGTKNIVVSFSLSTATSSYTPNSISGSGLMSLTSIPRNSKVSISGAFTIGEAKTINIQRFNNSFTHKIECYSYLTGKTKTIATDIQANSYTWTPSNDYYDFIPTDAKSGFIDIRLYTYSGETQIGSTSTSIARIQINEADCLPEFAPTAVDTWDNVINYATGDANTIVNIYNHTQVSFGTVTAKNGATIASKKVICGSKTLNGDGRMDNVTSGSFVFEVTDSRGLTSAKTVTKPFVNYYRPTISLTVGNITPDGECTLKMNGISFIGKFGNTSNAKTNSPSIVLWQKEQGSDYGDAIKTIAISNSTYSVETVIDNLDYKKTYVFKAQIRDTLVGAAGQTDEKAGNGLPVFCWNNNEFNFNVPVNMNSLKQTTFAENGFSINIIRLGNIVQVFMEAKMNQIPDIVAWGGYRLLTLPNGYRPILRVWTRLLSDGSNTWQDNYYWNIYPDGGVSLRTRNKAIDNWTSLGDGHSLWLSATFITNDSFPTD